MSMNNEQRVRRGLALTMVGLALQLGAKLHWTPLTFVISASVGVPLVLVGGLLFLSAVWRTLKAKGAL